MQSFPFHLKRCSIFCECFGDIKTSLFLRPQSIALIFAHTRNSQLAVSQIRGATTPVPHIWWQWWDIFFQRHLRNWRDEGEDEDSVDSEDEAESGDE